MDLSEVDAEFNMNNERQKMVRNTDRGDYMCYIALGGARGNGPQRWPPYSPPTIPPHFSAFGTVQGTVTQLVRPS